MLYLAMSSSCLTFHKCVSQIGSLQRWVLSNSLASKTVPLNVKDLPMLWRKYRSILSYFNEEMVNIPSWLTHSIQPCLVSWDPGSISCRHAPSPLNRWRGRSRTWARRTQTRTARAPRVPMPSSPPSWDCKCPSARIAWDARDRLKRESMHYSTPMGPGRQI